MIFFKFLTNLINSLSDSCFPKAISSANRIFTSSNFDILTLLSY